jgi:thiol-disulfide isomerase/thioredoxin
MFIYYKTRPPNPFGDHARGGSEWTKSSRVRMMRKSAMWLLAGLSLAAGCCAYIPTPQAGGFASATRSGAACSVRAAAGGVAAALGELQRLRARQLETAGRGRVTMDVETPHVQGVKNGEQWSELVATAAESGQLLVVMFKKDFCRKCVAMKPKFARLAMHNNNRNVMWADVDGVKLGKDLRKQLNLDRVPTFQVWGEGRVLEHFEADTDLATTVSKLQTAVDSYAGDPTTVPSDKVLFMELRERVEGAREVALGLTYNVPGGSSEDSDY